MKISESSCRDWKFSEGGNHVLDDFIPPAVPGIEDSWSVFVMPNLIMEFIEDDWDIRSFL